MRLEDLWEELKRRRVVRVALAYAAAVFVVLQVADLTFEPLGLPDSAYRILLVVALAGFPVAVALAWAFDVTPEGVRKEAAGVAAGARSMGPIVIGAAAVLAIGIGFWQLSRGAGPVVADEIDTDLVAVVPFRVSSTDERVTILREGVLDMLAPIFSERPRTVDTGAMVSAWRRFAGDESTELSEGQAVELARSLGAGRVLVGSVVGSGESFSMNARLLRVPGGDLIGDASVDGSADGLRSAVSQLAAQILSMEAGLERGQIDYLDAVPLEALEWYLRGRRAYRRSAYVEARTAFSRALDVDSTFALAAFGAREAVDMGIDADRFDLSSRATGLLRRHLDRLPPRDREFAELWLGPGHRRSAAELVATSGARMVSRIPDKAEAWYLYGDQLFHAQFRVGERDWGVRAGDAFRRALEIDPGLSVAREHLFYERMWSSWDTVGLRAAAEEHRVLTSGGEAALWGRGVLGFVLGDPTHGAWIETSVDTLSFMSATIALATAETPGARAPASLLDRLLDRLEATAVANADRRQALEIRYRYLRNAGRSSEADDALRLFEAAYGPQPRMWVEAALYWDGLDEPAQAAVPDLARRTAGEGPLDWASTARDACALELWRLRNGDTSGTTDVVQRLRAGADDPDPTRGRNALCALTLEALAADRAGAPEADRLVAELTEALDQGPTSVLMWTSLEAAWMLERRGEYAAAGRVAGYVPGNVPFPFARSTAFRESARLHERAGDLAAALHAYRDFEPLRSSVDPRFEDEMTIVRARIAELQAQVGPGVR